MGELNDIPYLQYYPVAGCRINEIYTVKSNEIVKIHEHKLYLKLKILALRWLIIPLLISRVIPAPLPLPGEPIFIRDGIPLILNSMSTKHLNYYSRGPEYQNFVVTGLIKCILK